MYKKIISQRIKIVLDFCLALISLIFLSPLFVIISLVIKLDDPGKVIFKQARAGKNGKLFYIYKFRTMVENAENMGLGYGIAKNDPRITRVGRFLRKTSLDELPQLFNVLKGEMSFVGPRPGLPYQVERYSAKQHRRLLVKPGITGLAQVQGRGLIPWSKRIEYDLWYIDHWSLWLDLKIMLRTVKNIILSKGYTEEQTPDIIEDFETSSPQNKERYV